ncbi:hypothetical protein [Pseudomonas sp. JUb96]|uniref:hypothetical protein n=1 Tax=Pseudomonas sp. JUb96 TaxID=2940539 RepID=UPI002227D9AC|nr:hypothetical protein [Pseudomonas sp. JUb96]MCW2267592.1 hypothetical protein [Pseudomonas sp. JUb96]
MINEAQVVAPRHYDIADVQRLRHDAELHKVDFSRARLATTNGKHTVTFDRPAVDLRSFGTAPEPFSHQSALQVEAVMLDALIRLHRAERQAVRIGAVYGWSTSDICRRPLTDAELAEHKARIKHAAMLVNLQEQLADAVQAQARKAQQVRESVDLAARYSVADGSKPLSDEETTADVLVAAMVNAPTKPRRASKRQQVSHHE